MYRFLLNLNPSGNEARNTRDVTILCYYLLQRRTEDACSKWLLCQFRALLQVIVTMPCQTLTK
jgi:hypothetical protein